MAFFQLTKRSTLIYLRDRASVFFSLLSMIIVIMLMVFFLGEMNIDAITAELSRLPGRDAAADRENASSLILLWTLAGIISINAVNVTMALYSTMVSDRVDGRLNSISTAPVSRLTIAASYICSAWLCSVIICAVTLAVSDIVCVAKGLGLFSLGVHLEMLGLIALNSFVFSGIMYCLAVIVRTPGAWSGIGTVVGTLVGFLGGIYLPIGSLSDGVAAALKCTPVIYGTALFRSVMMRDMWSATFDGAPAEMSDAFREVFGVDIFLFDHKLSAIACITMLAACGVIFLLAGGLLTKCSRNSDR